MQLERIGPVGISFPIMRNHGTSDENSWKDVAYVRYEEDRQQSCWASHRSLPPKECNEGNLHRKRRL
eukprot:scaffold1347_cov350-Pavlova_lutheri.AAC.72